MANDSTPDAEGKKPRNLQYTYRDRTGAISDDFTSDTVSVIVTPLVNGKPYTKSVECEAGALPGFATKDGKPRVPPAGTGIMATLFGLKTVVGNAVTGLKGEEKLDPERVFEACSARYENILAGVWAEGRQGGPQLKWVLAAIEACVQTQQGAPMDEQQKADLKAEVVKTGTKPWLDNPTIKAEFDAQAAKRSSEQAARSAEAAKTAPKGDNPLSAFLRKPA